MTKIKISENVQISRRTLVNYEKSKVGICKFLEITSIVKKNKLNEEDLIFLKSFLNLEGNETQEKKEILIFCLMKFEHFEELLLLSYKFYKLNLYANILESFLELNKKKKSSYNNKTKLEEDNVRFK